MTIFQEAALKPFDRQREIGQEAAVSGVFGNDHLNSLGIGISQEAVRAPARQLPAPTVCQMLCFG